MLNLLSKPETMWVMNWQKLNPRQMKKNYTALIKIFTMLLYSFMFMLFRYLFLVRVLQLVGGNTSMFISKHCCNLRSKSFLPHVTDLDESLSISQT
jgi:hypothetical protein